MVFYLRSLLRSETSGINNFIRVSFLTCSFLSYIGSARGFWIVRHGSLSTDRLDPIVQPDVVSSHVHTIVGAKNFGPTVDNETLLASECTTAPVQADMSSYWAPQLYYQSANGSLTLIPIQAVNTYCEPVI